MNAVVEVRALSPGEWRRLKAIRLHALSDTPLAYTTTLEEAQAFPDSLWRERAAGHSGGFEQITMIGVDGPKTVAMGVGLLRHRGRTPVASIVSVFVAPDYRRTAIGRAVMDGIETWAAESGAAATSLWVVDDNDGARRFYEELGYRRTPDRQQIRVPPVRWETRFEKALTGSRAGSADSSR